MAISLKKQLTQEHRLEEVVYHVPKFDTAYYNRAYGQGHQAGRISGRLMFYDFYAMEFLWSFLGSGQLTKGERETKRDSVLSKGHRFLPASAVDIIDDVYEQVSRASAHELIGYLRAATIQEFRHITDTSYGWSNFRNELITLYNAKKTITKSDYRTLVRRHIPRMEKYPDTLQRLLKYAKYYSKTATIDNHDPSDITADVSGKHPNVDQTPETPETPEPDATNSELPPVDPNAELDDVEPIDDPFYDPEDSTSASPSSEDPTYSSKDAYWKKDDLKEGYTYIPYVKASYKAILKSGITFHDMVIIFSNIDWSAGYGGQRWADGVEALINLIKAYESNNLEDINKVIDHIYDLQHNTGSLLNKGPMFISETDLNRRFKMTDIARFIPFVSPIVKKLILRYHTYLRPDKDTADTEANMENLENSPTLPLSAEEIEVLKKMGFKANGDAYQVQMRFVNKKKQAVHGVYYQLNKHKVGSFTNNGQFQSATGDPTKYVVSDNYKSDVKSFDTFADALAYLKRFESDMQIPIAANEPQTAAGDPKMQYINSHKKTYVSIDKAQTLLDIGMKWNGLCYVGLIPNSKFLTMYSFTDGTYLVGVKDEPQYTIFHSFEAALAYLKSNGNILPMAPASKAAAQQDIDKQSHAASGGNIAQYYLDETQKAQLQALVDNDLPHVPHANYNTQVSTTGMLMIVKQKYKVIQHMFSVGKNVASTYGKPFRIVTSGGGDKLFSTWEQTIEFIKHNLEALAGVNTSTLVAASAYNNNNAALPPNADSKSVYSAHVGIAKLPENTIRLTKEDEDGLIKLGFDPRIINNKVAYVHKNTGDLLRFWANDVARLSFVKQVGLAVKKTVQEMLNWLPSKYNESVVKSPIVTGATVGNVVNPNPSAQIAKATGVPAGILFATDIKNAGFTWYPEKGMYIDSTTGNTLTISPNRSSVLNAKNVPGLGDQTYKFQDLASLIMFLKVSYQSKKPTA